MFFLVPAYPGCPGQIPESRKMVVCCVCLSKPEANEQTTVRTAVYVLLCTAVVQHRTVLIIFRLYLQTNIIAQMQSVGWAGDDVCIYDECIMRLILTNGVVCVVSLCVSTACT